MNFGEVKTGAVEVEKRGTGFSAPKVDKSEVGKTETSAAAIMGAPKLDIITLVANVGLSHLAWYMKNFSGITIPYEVELKEIDPVSVVGKARDEEKAEVEEMVKKIVAYAADGTYTSVVPAIIVESGYLNETIADPNIAMLGSGITTPTTKPIKSDLTIEYVSEQTSNVSEVYLKTADLIAKTACLLLNISYSDLVGTNPKYGISFAFNGKDAYTVTLNNKVYQNVR